MIARVLTKTVIMMGTRRVMSSVLELFALRCLNVKLRCTFPQVERAKVGRKRVGRARITHRREEQ